MGFSARLPCSKALVGQAGSIRTTAGLNLGSGSSLSVASLTNDGTITWQASGSSSRLNGCRNNVVNNGTISSGVASDNYTTSAAALNFIETDADIDVDYAAASFHLAANVENADLMGNANFKGFGNGAAHIPTGSVGDNGLTGLDGIDTIAGDCGKNRILGGNQTDSLEGGDGGDQLNGSAGKDTLTGGTAADSFVFQNPVRSGATQGVSHSIGFEHSL